MKKNAVIFILCFLKTLFAVSQHQSIQVSYKEIMIKNPIDTSGAGQKNYKKDMFREVESLKDMIENVTYSLKANKNESLFTADDFMENDINPTLKEAILISSADGKFYSNKEENISFWQVNDGRKYYRITNENITQGWKITNETKKIGEYLCYKATNKILLNNKVPVEVVAWFVPEIPFSFGPKGYGGLPGLIIALNERGFYFYVDKIKFYKKKLSIEKPNKGELVSPDEYEKLIHNIIKY